LKKEKKCLKKYIELKVGDLVYSGLGSLGIIKAQVEYSYSQFGDKGYIVEWITGSSMTETLHEAAVEGWRENYLINFEPDQHSLDSDARL